MLKNKAKSEENLETILTIEENDTNNNSNSERFTKLNQKLKNINLKIKEYTDFINSNINTDNEQNKKRALLYLNHLDELYQIMPSFNKKEAIKEPQTLIGKTLLPIVGLMILGAGIAVRVAQRDFSVEVVSNNNLQNQTLIEQVEELGNKMSEALQTPQDYLLGGIDVFFSFAASLFPFGIKNLINLFSQEKKEQKINLNQFLPLEIIIQFIEKSLEKNNYKELELYEQQINSLCYELEIIIESHNEKRINNDQLELIASTEDYIKELNQLSKTDLIKQDYSFKKTVKNIGSNSLKWLITNLISHSVITLSSSYSAQTLTLTKYLQDLKTPSNIVSTFARATIMKLVNEHLIKKPLEIIINTFLACCKGNNNNQVSLKQFQKYIDNIIKKQNKAKQAAIVISSFLLITFVSNFIKTLAADITQSKGNFSEGMEQLNKTFWRWEMLGVALAVTASDMWNLQLGMKKILKSSTENKTQKMILDQAFANNWIEESEYDNNMRNYSTITTSNETTPLLNRTDLGYGSNCSSNSSNSEETSEINTYEKKQQSLLDKPENINEQDWQEAGSSSSSNSLDTNILFKEESLLETKNQSLPSSSNYSPHSNSNSITESLNNEETVIEVEKENDNNSKQINERTSLLQQESQNIHYPCTIL